MFFFIKSKKKKMQNNNRLHYAFQIKINLSLSHLEQCLFSFNCFMFTRTVNICELHELCLLIYIGAIIYNFQFKIPIKLTAALLEHVN